MKTNRDYQPEATSLVWFRRDLRLHNNPTLAWAAENRRQIIALYIDDREHEGESAPGAASRWWLQQSLKSLSHELAQHDIPLHCYQGDSATILIDLCQNCAADEILCNTISEPVLLQRDLQIQQRLAAASSVSLHRFDQDYLLQPSTLLNQAGKPYKVFTPFWKRLQQQLAITPPTLCASQIPITANHQPVSPYNAETLPLTEAHPWQKKLHRYWRPGEHYSWEQAGTFLQQQLQTYPQLRDYPARSATSALSASLHYGEITAVQLFHELGHNLDTRAREVWLRQLGWREFARYILWHFPHSTNEPFDTRFTESFWVPNPAYTEAWRRGETGIPIIDAGMAELWESGTMHNRVRMLSASFLTKNLNIPWPVGAAWFWETLVDADLANNCMGWQWVAGCGVDAAPYFRIFNPVKQASQFDPENRYSAHWNSSTPLPPLIDLDESRRAALQRFQQLKLKSSVDHRRSAV